MIIIASANGAVGMATAWAILAPGGSALDAVEAAIRLVEDNPDDHSVGYGGYPNLLGEVELDASLMDGTTLRTGAVGALKNIRHPISVARRVMADLPHELLVGEGAARFAAELGLPQENLLSPEAAQTWRAGIEGNGMIDWAGVPELLASLLQRAPQITRDPEHTTGTVNVIAQDRAGRIASGVSTSGWAWKYPGRLGDSPLIGAGNYADDRYGAATCTGWGEAAIRMGTARSVVLYLKAGYPLEAACREAYTDVAPLLRGTPNVLHIVALDRHGNHCAVSNAEDRTYVYQSDGMPNFVEAARVVMGGERRAESGKRRTENMSGKRGAQSGEQERRAESGKRRTGAESGKRRAENMSGKRGAESGEHERRAENGEHERRAESGKRGA